MKMNSFLGKRMLSLVREADFAHAGEAEAIDCVLRALPKDPHRSLLDAGCGRAGTANFIQQGGWGQVTGFDVEPESIADGSARFPDLQLVACDVVDAPRVLAPATFDLIYSFNAFYAFPDQPAALAALRKLAQPDGRLVIFDYTDPAGLFAGSAFAREPEASHWKPLSLAPLEEQWARAGWGVETIERLDADYLRWYQNLVARIKARQAEVEAIGGAEGYSHMLRTYTMLLDAVEASEVGGATVWARAM